ncbi:MAG TPA: ferrochelatase [Caulobacteraceae bacterium]
MTRRVAVVLFNLGGPDGPDAVCPFLFNLFNDPAIIGLPALFRTPLARLISSRREETAKANYAIMGGGSPLLPETRKQAEALDAELARRLRDAEARCFIAMRYWKPFVEDAAAEVAAWGPDEIVLLPLYPQFSTTTTGSSLQAWEKAYRGPGRARAVCCYPDQPGFVDAYADAVRLTWEQAGRPENVRLLFSAHGLPEKVVKGGDPYQAQVEATAAVVLARLAPWSPEWEICYQSRVGPLKWIGPATDDCVRAAGAEGKGVLLAPIAFVSEHVETLVELDHEYRALADASGVPVYLRAPTVSVMHSFIAGLAETVTAALARPPATETACGGRWCDARWSRCPARAA